MAATVAWNNFAQQTTAYAAAQLPIFLGNLEKIESNTLSLLSDYRGRYRGAATPDFQLREDEVYTRMPGDCPSNGALAYVWKDIFRKAQTNLRDLTTTVPIRGVSFSDFRRWARLVALNEALVLRATNINPMFLFPTTTWWAFQGRTTPSPSAGSGDLDYRSALHQPVNGGIQKRWPGVARCAATEPVPQEWVISTGARRPSLPIWTGLGTSPFRGPGDAGGGRRWDPNEISYYVLAANTSVGPNGQSPDDFRYRRPLWLGAPGSVEIGSTVINAATNEYDVACGWGTTFTTGDTSGPRQIKPAFFSQFGADVLLDRVASNPNEGMTLSAALPANTPTRFWVFSPGSVWMNEMSEIPAFSASWGTRLSAEERERYLLRLWRLAFERWRYEPYKPWVVLERPEGLTGVYALSPASAITDVRNRALIFSQLDLTRVLQESVSFYKTNHLRKWADQLHLTPADITAEAAQVREVSSGNYTLVSSTIASGASAVNPVAGAVLTAVYEVLRGVFSPIQNVLDRVLATQRPVPAALFLRQPPEACVASVLDAPSSVPSSGGGAAPTSQPAFSYQTPPAVSPGSGADSGPPDVNTSGGSTSGGGAGAIVFGLVALIVGIRLLRK